MEATACVRRICAVLVVIAVYGAPIRAQEISVDRLAPPKGSEPQIVYDDLGINHVTDKLFRSEEGQKAFHNFLEAKRQGLLPLSKSDTGHLPGDARDFNILRPFGGDNPNWIKVNFTLRTSSSVADIWVETSLIDNVSDDHIGEFEHSLLNETPASSIMPNNGIIENNHYLFGDPPNIDGDGKVDILLYDIVEAEGESCCILGFVSPTDLDLTAPEDEGNKRDVLHVDVVEGFGNSAGRLAWVTAHEHQHLIHFNYQESGSPELTFINEGLSEYASVANGYFDREITFPSFPQEHNVPMFEWREPAFLDYERAGLFTTYIAQRITPEGAGSIVAARRKAEFGSDSIYVTGAEGYSIVLERRDLTLAEIITDYHTSLFLNDQSVDERFGFAATQRKDVKAGPTVEIDGRTQSSAELLGMEINAGAVRFIDFSDVGNVTFTADIPAATVDILKPDLRARKNLRVILEGLNGGIETVDVEPGPDPHVFQGQFVHLTLQISDTRPSTGAVATKFDVTAEWDDGSGQQFEREIISYDSGEIDEDTLFTVFEEPRMMATKFDVPEGADLVAVSIAPVYCNQFSNCSELGFDGSAEAPRDFRLHVWADDNGLPGEEIYSTVVTDAPAGTHLNFSTMEFDFFRIKMDTTSIAQGLSGTVHFGFSNAGDDENVLITALSQRSGEDVSSIFFTNDEIPDGAWAPFDSITVGDEPIFAGKVAPIRVELLVPTGPVATDDADELPNATILAQNFPNPFNPTTAITYKLPASGHVRLAVYDALGRHVATLVDGVQTSGEHQVRVDGSDWSSGVYFYTLESEGRRQTRNMVLLK